VTGDHLLQPILAAPPGRPFVVGQLGQSLDGRIATESGESKWINRACALDHLHRLRSVVDAVVVGVGTVVADDPMLTVRRVPGPHPARVVIDPSGRLPLAPLCMTDNGVRRYVVRAVDAPVPDGVEEIRLPRLDGLCAPKAVIDALFALGFRRILIEGGAWTVSAFLAAGILDRLHVLVAPVILGSGKPGLSLPPIARLDDALRPTTSVHPLPDGDVLFDCDLRGGRP
jgi:riboflavin-specific deaminase-like protein